MRLVFIDKNRNIKTFGPRSGSKKYSFFFIENLNRKSKILYCFPTQILKVYRENHSSKYSQANPGFIQESSTSTIRLTLFG